MYREAERLGADLQAELPDEFRVLQRFQKRFNKVLLEKMALENRKGGLQEENQHLRLILKQYLDGISVNEEVLSERNPLIVVNGNTNAPCVSQLHP